MPSRFRALARVHEVMTRLPHVVSPELPLNDAWSRMKRESLRHLPVVRDGRLIGLLSERSVRLAVAYEGAIQMTVADAMVAPPFMVPPETPLFDVCTQMANQRHGSAVVVDADQKPVGIFTAQDALRILGEILKEETSSGRKAA